MKNRFLAAFLTIAMALSLMTACAKSQEPLNTATEAQSVSEKTEVTAETRAFTDSCGRTLMIPQEVKRIAVSGPLAQVYVYPLCPELMVGYCSAFSKDAEKYIKKDFLALPELGQLYGGKGTMDLEALLAAEPDVVIDVGEAKGNIAEDFDALYEQTGIPFVHIEATVATAPAAYRLLGELTGCTQQAERLASWCENTLQLMNDMMTKVDADGARKRIIYSLGDKGLNCLAQGSFHADTINMMGKNVAELETVLPTGDGNEIDMEQLILWDPEYIIFDSNSIYETVFDDPAWQQLSAVKAGNVFESPFGPYGWLATPPAVQRYLGMLWLGALLYPDYVEYDLQEKVTEYYEIFYGYSLNAAEYSELTKNAMPK